MNIGEVMRKLRKEKKMTLRELSDKSGVALATLSRMENGKMTGTLDSHMKICEALEVQIHELYKNVMASVKKVDLQTSKSRPGVFMHDKKSSSEILVSNALNKKMMPMIIKISKNSRTPVEENKVGVEKFIYVLDGKINASVGEENFNLSKGDTLYFEAVSPHSYKNTGLNEARIICITAPPVL